MDSQKNNNLLGTLILLSGMVIGACGALLYHENKPKSAGTVLHQIRETFNQGGEVCGSWIDYDPVEYHGFDSQPLVYMGGISRKEEGEIVHYRFAADVYTGDILSIQVQ